MASLLQTIDLIWFAASRDNAEVTAAYLGTADMAETGSDPEIQEVDA